MCFFNRKESRVRYKSNFGLKIVLSLLLAVEIFVIYAVQITDTIFYSCSSMTDVQNYLFFALVEASPYLFFVGIMYCALLLMTIFFVWREHTKNLFCYLSLVAFSVYDVISYRFFYSESRGFYKNEGFGVALQLGIVVLAVVFAIVCKNKNKTIEENPVSSEERALSFTVLAQVVLSVVQCVLRSV
ncbi:MAG: hypothetical protein GX683_00230, partial [Ruminococcaceae bacterium]|nr:hypothetical protein [Oscillospiraceae bacterium]